MIDYTDFDYIDLIIIIFILLVCILRYLQAYIIIKVIGLVVVSITSIYIIGMTTYNILLLMPIGIMYATWKELEEDDTESQTTTTIRKKINTIMKRIFWIMSLVQMIIIGYIYVKHTSLGYMSEVIWDYGITIEQSFTLEEKINYIDQYIPILKEYYENDPTIKSYEDSMLEQTVAGVQTTYPSENDIRERIINALGNISNIRRHIIINDMRERIIEGISNVRIMDMPQYIMVDIINKELQERLDKARDTVMDNLYEEMERLHKRRRYRKIYDDYPQIAFFIRNVVLIVNFAGRITYIYDTVRAIYPTLTIAYRLYGIYIGFPNNYVDIYRIARKATRAVMYINTLLPLKSIQSKLRYMYKILEFIGFRKGDRPIYGS
jgi:hypothetical protein